MGTQYLTAIKIVVLVNATLLTAQLAVHAAQHYGAEQARPTPESWPFRARYCLRQARIAQPWNPFSAAAKPLSETLAYLDRALAALAAAEATQGRAELHIERGECLERMQRFDEAADAYAAALDSPSSSPSARCAVAAAVRLAKILEWRGSNHDGAVGALLQRAADAATGADDAEASANAQYEMAVFLARRGRLARALEVATQVLELRKRAAAAAAEGGGGGGRVADGKRYTASAGDPCRIAATEALIGELLFAIGQRAQGVAWSERAFGAAVALADLRLACKQCASVAAGNLIRMGEIMKDGVGAGGGAGARDGAAGRGKWRWLWRTAPGSSEHDEGRRLVDEYIWRKVEVDAIKAVRDAAEARAAPV